MVAPKNKSAHILIGLAGLVAGALIYLVDRPPEATYFIKEGLGSINMHNRVPNLFGTWACFLPSFFHSFSLSVLTCAFVTPSKIVQGIVCASWFSINALFEILQKFKTTVLDILPTWLDHYPILDSVRNYFQFGTFDAMDIALSLAGSVAAFIVLTTVLSSQGKQIAQPQT